MRRILLSAAILVGAISIPVAAGAQMSASRSSSGGGGHHRGDDHRLRAGFDQRSAFGRDFCRDGVRDRRDFRRDRRDDDHGDRGDRRRNRDRRSGDCTIIGGDLGYLDYGDYDANRSFDPDKWNDWWHERTYRSYPRWVQQSAERGDDTCDPSRMWWSGTGWHC